MEILYMRAGTGNGDAAALAALFTEDAALVTNNRTDLPDGRPSNCGAALTEGSESAL
jgi:hypothetical protein